MLAAAVTTPRGSIATPITPEVSRVAPVTAVIAPAVDSSTAAERPHRRRIPSAGSWPTMSVPRGSNGARSQRAIPSLGSSGLMCIESGTPSGPIRQANVRPHPGHLCTRRYSPFIARNSRSGPQASGMNVPHPQVSCVTSLIAPASASRAPIYRERSGARPGVSSSAPAIRYVPGGSYRPAPVRRRGGRLGHRFLTPLFPG